MNFRGDKTKDTGDGSDFQGKWGSETSDFSLVENLEPVKNSRPF